MTMAISILLTGLQVRRNPFEAIPVSMRENVGLRAYRFKQRVNKCERVAHKEHKGRCEMPLILPA